ncbi:MAG TPA: NAD(P)-dependent oxidoreductase [Verrucomicrobiales bacterium]|nr:NAD(P)-dependent oxidoreductase [Verrucomicrobiales bacterium]
MKRILLSTTSFQDTPGEHQAILEQSGFDLVRERGPLGEERMLELAGKLDGLLCGDDVLSRRVLEAMRPRLEVISKYGIGLDKIDLDACREFGIPVFFTPGVNHTTVAEHTFCLLLAMVRHLVEEVNHTRAGRWIRVTGNELWRKRMGLVGLGRIGIEVAKRARGFEMELWGYGNHWPAEAAELGIVRCASLKELFGNCDVLSLHTRLRDETRHIVNAALLEGMREGAILINTSRGELVDTAAVLKALDAGTLAGYATDVLEEEPPPPEYPLLRHAKVLATPHIGSRTYESVPRQAMRATLNLVHYFENNPEPFRAV